MEMRTHVSFDTSGFPNESQWTENGSILVPDGRSVANAIIAGVRKAGITASEAVQHEFYGWAFDVVHNDGTAWCLLQYPGPWLLLVRQKRSIIKRLLQRNASGSMEVVLRAIDSFLRLDRRFSSIQWFTEHEYDSGSPRGADAPL